MVIAKPTAELSNLLEHREQAFESFVETTLEPFWQSQVTESFFTNSQQLTINYAFTIPEGAKQLIVVSPGRVEGYLKYKELVYDLAKLGYAVAVIDHQGQGLSTRRLENPHKGYVENFNDYVLDLHQLVEQQLKPRFDGEFYFLSHSMGGAIGLRYIQQYPDTFKKAVFSSPMWGLSAGPLPKSVAKGIVSSINWVNGLVTSESSYFMGAKDYEPPSFEDNVLTHSKARYQYFRDTYEKNPQLKLGGITFNWLVQSIQALEVAQDELNKVKTPILVVQAGGDRVIDNSGQDLFCEKLQQHGQPCFSGKPIVVADAEHELFIEQDKMRNQLMTQIIEFYQN